MLTLSSLFLARFRDFKCQNRPKDSKVIQGYRREALFHKASRRFKYSESIPNGREKVSSAGDVLHVAGQLGRDWILSPGSWKSISISKPLKSIFLFAIIAVVRYRSISQGM